MPASEQTPTSAAGMTAVGRLGDPASVLAVLRAERRAIALGVAACLLVAVGYLALAPRVYEASARLLIVQQGGRPIGAGAADPARWAEGGDDYLATHALILRSPLVVGSAIEAIEGASDSPSARAAATRRAIQNLTVTRPDRIAKVLQVDYRAGSPEAAIRMVGALTASYRRFLEDVYQKNNGDVISLMTRARDDLNTELQELERQYLEFRKGSDALTTGGSGQPLANRRIDEWDRALNDAQVRAIELKAKLELGRKLAGDGVGLTTLALAMDQIGDRAGGVLGARAQGIAPGGPSDYLRQLSQEQQRLAEQYGPQATKVRELDERIGEVQEHARSTRNRLDKQEIGDLLDALGAGLKTLDAMKAELARAYGKDLTAAKAAELARLTDQNLRENLDRHRTLFNTVVDQLKQAKLTGDFSGTWSHLIEPPTAPSKPVRPLTSMTLALALAAGGVLGTLAALGRHALDPRIRSPQELRRLFDFPLLGQAPRLDESPLGRARPPGLICRDLPHSPSAEAYKVLRANLDLLRRDPGLRVVLVTSPLAGEGKSTVASNLATCLAQAGRMVLLVDADLRTPVQHAIHQAHRERGLSHVLRDLLSLSRVVQKTTVENLWIVASGPEAPNPAELLSSSCLAAFLAEARDGFDAVVVDAPALLTVADPSLLGAAADGILLVVRQGVTTRADALRAVEVLRGLGTPILGAVLNGAAPGTSSGALIPDEAARGRLADLERALGDDLIRGTVPTRPGRPRASSPNGSGGEDR